MSSNPLEIPEFLFGDLSTPQGRLKQARMARVGFYHEPHLMPLDPKEHEPIQINVRVGEEISVKDVTLYYTTDGSAPVIQATSAHHSTFQVPMKRTEIEWDTLQWCYLEKWTGEIPGQPQGNHVQYSITATTTADKTIFCPYIDLNTLSKLEDLENFNLKILKNLNRETQPQVYAFYVDNETIPQWLKEAVIYEIFVDRFAPDPGTKFATPPDLSGFYGGTIKGIISKLDYLSELGVTCLWLTPIFPSPSHHGYDPLDHSTIEPRIGTEEDWQTLVKEAHQRGIRIILDYVANHLSNQHPTFQDAQKDKNSPAYKWFRFRDWPYEYDSFLNVIIQPELNSDHPAVRDYLINNACQWLKRGCDGFRLDYAQGLTLAFWSSFRAATRNVKPDSVTFGEITETPYSMRPFIGRMDGCLDFKVVELLRNFFAFGTLTVSQFDKTLRQNFAYFGSHLVLPTFLDNHDMNRFLWLVEGDKRRLKLAALCQFTLPGPPIIYNGAEVGVSQIKPAGRLEETRLPMRWGEEQDIELLTFYKQLIAFRHQNPQIWSQAPQPLVVDDEKWVYSYVCGNYAIALNNSPHSVTIPFASYHKGKLVFTTDTEILWDEQTSQLTLMPFSGAVVHS